MLLRGKVKEVSNLELEGISYLLKFDYIKGSIAILILLYLLERYPNKFRQLLLG